MFFFANRYKELAEKLVQLEESFVHSSRLAFQNKKFMEQSNVVFFVWFFFGVFRHKAKSIVFFLQMALKASEKCP